MSATKPVFLVSDAHLEATPTPRERDLIAWLGQAAAVASAIIVNGDLFDFWFEYRSGPSRGHEAVLAELRRVVDAGVPVTLVGGNHDWWGGDYLRNEIGVEFLHDAVVREIAGRRTLLAHGDGLGKGDVGYRALRAVLRGGVTRAAFSLLPPALGDRIARGVSRTDRKLAGWEEEQLARSTALERWAETRLAEAPELEVILLGHTHLPMVREVAPGRWYVNSGDWLIHRSYLTLSEGCAPSLREWEGRL